MKASYFNRLVQNTHDESDVQPALPGVVPGIVYTAPISTLTGPRTLHNTQSKTKQVTKKKKAYFVKCFTKISNISLFFSGSLCTKKWIELTRDSGLPLSFKKKKKKNS